MVPLPGSLGGHHVYRTTHPTFGDVVVKTPRDDSSMKHEVTVHAAVNGTPGVVPLLTHTRDPWSLTTAYVPADANTRACWDAGTAYAALRVLTAVSEKLPVLAGARVIGEHPGDQAAARRAAGSAQGDRRMLTAWNFLAAYPRENLTLAHGDPKPENWVLTTAGPVLLDFSAVGLAPPLWDHALFLAHQPALSVEDCRGLARSHGVPWTLVQVAAAAYWALAADDSQSRNPLLRAWGERYMGHFRDVACADLSPRLTRA